MISEHKVLTRPSKPGNPPWDNEENDLIVSTNDHIGDIHNTYIIKAMLGRGAFGQVVSVVNVNSGEYSAIKIAKSPHAYFESAKNEAEILKILARTNKNHFVNIENEFIFNQHYCIVMERLDRNLYEMLKLRNFRGFSHSENKTVCRQILFGMADMKKIGLVHCDLKPENVLIVHGGLMKVKIIDFGSAFFHMRNHTYYVQSRFYRAPEVITGLPYSGAIDVWSFACVAFELITGRPLFPGKDNEDQIRRIEYFFKSFDKKDGDDIRFNPIGNQDESCEILHPMYFQKDYYFDKKSIEILIHSTSDDRKNNILFLDFIFFCLKEKPVERPVPLEILKHPYLAGNMDYSCYKIEPTDGVVERDLNHPPPKDNLNRRYTTTFRNRNNYVVRKQSEYKH